MPRARNADYGAGMDVVAVDDDPAGLDLLRMVLEADGHTVRTCRSAADALDRLADGAPDILVTDLMMGPDRRDGFRLIDEVRGRPELARVPVVILSGMTSREELGRARAAGADVCLTKPVDIAELLQVFRSISRR